VEAFLALADRFGLGLAVIAVVAWAIYKRVLITGSEKERSDEAWARELQYREDRRVEERRARLAAESALRKVTDSMAKLTDQTDRMADLIEQALRKQVLP
jgi:hypothetical protein